MKSFAVDIKKFTDKVKGREKVFFQKLIIDIDTGVVYMTPVDTGRAQANWNVGINNVDLTEHEPELNPQAVIDRVKSLIRQISVSDVVYVSNNLDYIEHLEEGSSQQAPSGMVAITLQRFEQIVGSAVQHSKMQVP